MYIECCLTTVLDTAGYAPTIQQETIDFLPKITITRLGLQCQTPALSKV